jgi:menaquinol-cytochrome c reductase iron-sulfur subunit
MRRSDPDRSPCPCAGDPPDHEAPPSPERRRFVARLSGGLVALATVLASVPLIGAFFSPVLRRNPLAWREVGALDDFPVGDTVMVRYLDPEPLPWAGYAGRSAAWVRRDEEEMVAFSMYCTHAGCPVTWSPGAGMFMCPCHGGVFHRDGSVAAGPPPRPLEQLPIRIRDGRVELLTIGAPRTEA